MQSREGEKKNDAKRVRSWNASSALKPQQGLTTVMVKGTSSYAQRMNAAGREIFGCEIDVELADAIRSLAAKEGIKTSAWLKKDWANTVRAAGLQYTPKDPASKLSAAEQKVAELEAKLAELEAASKK